MSGGNCTQIWAEVRQNGTDAKFSDCSEVNKKNKLNSQNYLKSVYR